MFRYQGCSQAMQPHFDSGAEHRLRMLQLIDGVKAKLTYYSEVAESLVLERSERLL